MENVEKGNVLIPKAIIIGAVVGLVAGLTIAILIKHLPSFVAYRMSKMMEVFEKAGFEPPCAQILKQEMRRS